MRAKAYLLTAVLCSCNVASPCKEQGGRCVRTDVLCGDQEIFSGYDPGCGEASKCCLPANGGGASDCARRGGTCIGAGKTCATETEALGGLCPNASDICCAPLPVGCLKAGGHCLPNETPCPTGQVAVGAGFCASGLQCCAPLGTCLKGRCILKTAKCSPDEREVQDGSMCSDLAKCCVPL